MTFYCVAGYGQNNLEPPESSSSPLRYRKTCDMTQSSFSITFEDSGGGGGEMSSSCSSSSSSEGDKNERRIQRESRLDISYTESTGGIRFQESHTQVSALASVVKLIFFMVPVPVPTFEKLRLRFRLLTSYGYGSGSVPRP
jgi:hypothetical protein